MLIEDPDKRQHLRNYLIALSQKEADVMGTFVILLQNIVSFFEAKIGREEIDHSLMIARATLELLINNNEKELSHLQNNDMAKPLFKLTLRELIELRDALDTFKITPTENKAEYILNLARTLEKQENEEADEMRKEA